MYTRKKRLSRGLGWESSRLFTLLQPIQIPNPISWREVQKLSL
jgi:hypothetical protein